MHRPREEKPNPATFKKFMERTLEAHKKEKQICFKGACAVYKTCSWCPFTGDVLQGVPNCFDLKRAIAKLKTKEVELLFKEHKEFLLEYRGTKKQQQQATAIYEELIKSGRLKV